MTRDIFSIQEEVFKLIANHKRLEILLLLESTDLNVNDMATMLGLRQANLSQHLTLLRTHHLVNVRRKGRESFYSLADQSIADAIRSIQNFLLRTHQVETPIDNQALFPIVTDPVCGMRFSASKAYSHLMTANDNAVYFCASGCADKYVDELNYSEAAKTSA